MRRVMRVGIWNDVGNENNRLQGETGRMLAGVRYLLLMMGFFAVRASAADSLARAGRAAQQI